MFNFFRFFFFFFFFFLLLLLLFFSGDLIKSGSIGALDIAEYNQRMMGSAIILHQLQPGDRKFWIEAYLRSTEGIFQRATQGAPVFS